MYYGTLKTRKVGLREIKADADLMEAVLEVAREGLERLERKAALLPKDDLTESKNRRLFVLAQLNRAKRAVQDLEHKILFS